MRHLAAYLLAAISENEIPTEAKIQSILGSVGVEADDKQLKVVIEKFAGRPPSKIIADGQRLLASVPTVSAGAVAAPGGSKPAAVAAAAPAAKEVKKEEKKPEPEEESDDDMGFGLFD